MITGRNADRGRVWMTEAARPNPLEEVRYMYAFPEHELPQLFDRWAEERVKGRKEAP